MIYEIEENGRKRKINALEAPNQLEVHGRLWPTKNQCVLVCLPSFGVDHVAPGRNVHVLHHGCEVTIDGAGAGTDDESSLLSSRVCGFEGEVGGVPVGAGIGT